MHSVVCPLMKSGSSTVYVQIKHQPTEIFSRYVWLLPEVRSAENGSYRPKFDWRGV